MEEEPQAMEASPPPGNLPSFAISPPRSPPTMAAASPPSSSPLTTTVNHRPMPAHALSLATPSPGPGYSTRIPSSSSRFASTATASSSSGSPTAPATFPAESGLHRLPCQIRIFLALLHATGRMVERDVSALASETRRDMLNTNLALLGIAPLGLGAWMPCSVRPSPPPRARCHPPTTRYGFVTAAHAEGLPSSSRTTGIGLWPLPSPSPPDRNTPFRWLSTAGCLHNRSVVGP